MLPTLIQPQERFQKSLQHTAATEKQTRLVQLTTLSYVYHFKIRKIHVQTHIELPALFLNSVHPVEQSIYSSFNVTTCETERE